MLALDIRNLPPTRRETALISGLIALLALSVCLCVYGYGGTKLAYVHLGYLPGILAGLIFGMWAGAGCGAAMGLLLGPFMPLDTQLGIPQDLESWSFQGVFFVLLAFIAGALSQALRSQIRSARLLSRRDNATRLPNQRALLADLERDCARRDAQTALLVIHLSALEEVRLSMGRDASDQFLKTITAILQDLVAPAALYRIHETHFATICHSRDVNALREYAQQIVAALEVPVTVRQTAMHIEPHLGIACYPLHADNPWALLQSASFAARIACNEDRGFGFYDAPRHNGHIEAQAIRRDFQQAVDDCTGIALHYQPIIDLPTGAMVGAEALIRWTHAERGAVSPGTFIPIIEQTVLMDRLTKQVLPPRLRAMGRVGRTGPGSQTVDQSVDAEPAGRGHRPRRDGDVAALRRPPGADLFRDYRDRHHEGVGGGAGHLHAPARARASQIAIDDFGTGHSSLSYLHKIPADIVKLDRSFLQGITTDPDTRKNRLARDRALSRPRPPHRGRRGRDSGEGGSDAQPRLRHGAGIPLRQARSRPTTLRRSCRSPTPKLPDQRRRFDMHYVLMLLIGAGISVYFNGVSSGFDDAYETLRQHHYTEAADRFSAALESGTLGDKNAAAAYNNRAVARYAIGDQNGAVHDFRAGVHPRPGAPRLTAATSPKRRAAAERPASTPPAWAPICGPSNARSCSDCSDPLGRSDIPANAHTRPDRYRHVPSFADPSRPVFPGGLPFPHFRWAADDLRVDPHRRSAERLVSPTPAFAPAASSNSASNSRCRATRSRRPELTPFHRGNSAQPTFSERFVLALWGSCALMPAILRREPPIHPRRYGRFQYLSRSPAMKIDLHYAAHAAVLIGLTVLVAAPAHAQDPKRSDAVVRDISEAFANDPFLKTQHLAVSNAAGAVTVSGTANDLLVRERATRLASHVAGVLSVDNNVMLAPRTVETQPEPAAVSQEAPSAPVDKSPAPAPPFSPAHADPGHAAKDIAAATALTETSVLTGLRTGRTR